MAPASTTPSPSPARIVGAAAARIRTMGSGSVTGSTVTGAGSGTSVVSRWISSSIGSDGEARFGAGVPKDWTGPSPVGTACMSCQTCLGRAMR